jgi:DNA repair exonuclease SbcCD ATPase subunit
MITYGKLTLKNFLSIGAVEQTIDLNTNNLTLILGENLDLGGESARNGTGKTTILQGLSYAQFGVPINNIKKDNLINRTNSKGMSVKFEFAVDNVKYRIERGRKPTFLKFYIDDKEQTSEETNDSQGDSRQTQDAIERIVQMSPDMFRHIVGLNTYTEPFLALKVSDQRVIIEQLLGITILSEKAEMIKKMNTSTKLSIQTEDIRIKAVQEANVRIQEQIESLKRRQRLWIAKHDEDLSKLVSEYDELSKIDIDAELQAHKDLTIYITCLEKKTRYDDLISKQLSWNKTKTKDIATLQEKLTKLNSIDIDSELQAHKDFANYNIKSKKISELNKWIKLNLIDEARETKIIDQLKVEIAALEEHKCHACGHDLHDDSHEQMLSDKRIALQEAAIQALHTNTQWIENTQALSDLGELGTIPKVFYNIEEEAIKHSYSVLNLQTEMFSKIQEEDPYAVQINDLSNEEIVCGDKPITHYKTESEAIKHSSRVESLLDQITNKNDETEPYSEQISEMEQNAIQPISFDTINELTRVMQHQEYLLDLLTNKKSFVRKKIIEQNLTYLNSRLTHYLTSLGLPHEVLFVNDLSVQITELGRELDFDNLSRGERTRLILALNFAFRDVFESLFQSSNLVFVDELIDNGLDTAGVENALALLKHMSRTLNKSVFLVSHREELSSRVGSILKVIKENGYTRYENENDVES